jgi:transcriptional regulator with XRE-family HTH domain
VGVGAYLRRTRERLGISLRAMSRMSGINPTSLSQYERDEVSFTVDSLQRVCKWYGIEPWEALAGKSKLEIYEELKKDPQLSAEHKRGLDAAARDPEISEILRQLEEIAREKGPDALKRVLAVYALMNQSEE